MALVLKVVKTQAERRASYRGDGFAWLELPHLVPSENMRAFSDSLLKEVSKIPSCIGFTNYEASLCFTEEIQRCLLGINSCEGKKESKMGQKERQEALGLFKIENVIQKEKSCCILAYSKHSCCESFHSVTLFLSYRISVLFFLIVYLSLLIYCFCSYRVYWISSSYLFSLSVHSASL